MFVVPYFQFVDPPVAGGWADQYPAHHPWVKGGSTESIESVVP